MCPLLQTSLVGRFPRNLCFHCRRHRFDPWSGNYPACHVVKKQTTNVPTPQNISPKGNQESTHPASYHTDVDTEPGRSASRPRSAKSEGQSQPSSQGAMPQPPPRPGCLPPLLQACSRVSGCQPRRLSQSCSPWKTVWLYSETPTISTMDGDEASRAPGRRALRGWKEQTQSGMDPGETGVGLVITVQ